MRYSKRNPDLSNIISHIRARLYADERIQDNPELLKDMDKTLEEVYDIYAKDILYCERCKKNPAYPFLVAFNIKKHKVMRSCKSCAEKGVK